MVSATGGLRERKKAATRRALQNAALRLFAAQGYDATTVDQIASAVGVSPMTFFRYFPTKEDVVLQDEYDELLAARLAAQPSDATPLEQLQTAVRDGLAETYALGRDALLARLRLIIATPALRARLFANQGPTEQLLIDFFSRNGDSADPLRPRVIAAACLGALTAAILTWAEQDGEPSLPELIDHAFGVLRRELS